MVKGNATRQLLSWKTMGKSGRKRKLASSWNVLPYCGRVFEGAGYSQDWANQSLRLLFTRNAQLGRGSTLLPDCPT